MTHRLKIWPGSFTAVQTGEKTHEIRSTKDRTFTKGDHIILREWVPDTTKPINGGEDAEVTSGHFTGNCVLRTITYVSQPGSWGLPDDICVFSMR